MTYYHLIEIGINFLIALSWPIIILIIFLTLKEPIKNVVTNIKKINYAGAGIETNSARNQDDDNSLIERLGDGKNDAYLDNALSKFSDFTLGRAETIIEDETKISEVEGLQNQYDRIYKYSKLLVLIKNFEKMYDSIYGSQIRLLQRLNHTTTETSSSLKLYYDMAKETYPSGYKDYSYESYLGFLKNQGLVYQEEGSENIQITFIGKDFLRYMLEANLSLDKLY